MKRTVRIAFSVAISIVFLIFAARGVDWSKTWAALTSAHYIYVVPMVAITVWTLYIRAQRWRILLRPIGAPPLRTLVAATNIGFMANMVLPLRVGEVIRPALLSRKERKPLGAILATIVLERIFDLLTILLLFGISAAMVGVSDTLSHWGFRMCGLGVLLAAGVIFVRWQEDLALRLLRLLVRPFPATVGGPIEHFFRGFVQALEILDSPQAFLQVVAWSLYLWAVIASIYLLGIRAFDLPAPLVLGAIVVTAITAIAVSAPSAPGYIGALQIGCTLSLAIFGVAESNAFAYSIVVHITQFVGVVGAGLYSLAREGMSLRSFEEGFESNATAT